MRRCIRARHTSRRVSSTRKDSTQERRGSRRFPVASQVRYRIIGSGLPTPYFRGTVVNMSSTGILFTTERVLLNDQLVEIEMDWPVKLQDSVPLKLVILGRIVRTQSGPSPSAGLRIARHEFRTAAPKSA